MTVSHVSTKPNAVWHICLASLEESNELVDVQNYFPLNKTLTKPLLWHSGMPKVTPKVLFVRYFKELNYMTTYFPCIPSPFKFLTFSLQLFMKESSIYIIGSGPNGTGFRGPKSRLPTSLMLQQLIIPVAQHWSWSPNFWVWCLIGNVIQSSNQTQLEQISILLSIPPPHHTS